jgi:hypothetical protein
MVETLRLTLYLNQFSDLPLFDGSMESVKQLGSDVGAALRAFVEPTGVGDLHRKKGTAIGTSNHIPILTSQKSHSQK